MNFAKFEEFDLTTNDGAKLNAVLIKKDGTRGVVLYFHGTEDKVIP